MAVRVFTVYERLTLGGLLNGYGPKAGNLTTHAILSKLQEDLSFSEEEHEILKIEVKDNRVVWQNEDKVRKEISVGPKARGIIKQCLELANSNETLAFDRVRDDNGKITVPMVELYKEFVGALPEVKDEEEPSVQENKYELVKEV